MKNLIAIDIGNTNITAGIFKSGSLIKKAKMPTHAYSLYEKKMKGMVGDDLDLKKGQEVIISSVVPVALCRLIVHLNKIMKAKIAIVGKDLKAPIKNMYKVKSEVGQDRLVNAFAAKKIYGAPSVIIDFGTAITFDVLSKRGEYLGGLIMPGIELSLSSLYHRTALLPRVSLKESKGIGIIGRDTENSMRGGILFGFGAMCDGLISRYKKILGNDLKVIATGGNAGLIKKYAKTIKVVDEDLTLKGLFLIAEKKS